MATKGRGDRQIRFARILGLAFIVAGFAAIGFGWIGMARVAATNVYKFLKGEQPPNIV